MICQGSKIVDGYTGNIVIPEIVKPGIHCIYMHSTHSTHYSLHAHYTYTHTQLSHTVHIRHTTFSTCTYAHYTYVYTHTIITHTVHIQHTTLYMHTRTLYIYTHCKMFKLFQNVFRLLGKLLITPVTLFTPTVVLL